MLNEALEIHNYLNPALWDKNQNLLPEVEDRLHKIVNKFQAECMLPLDIVDVHLVGSNASFNYTSHSDLDVHIIVNFSLVDCDKEILMAAYELQKSKFNKDYNISIRGIEVELYIEDIESNVMSNGIYSLYEKRWIKKPQPIQIPDIDVTEQVNKISRKVRTVLKKNDMAEVTKMINFLYMMRKNSLTVEGEFGTGNLIFKGIRDLGLLDDLKQKLKELQSQELTLEHLNEDLLQENVWFGMRSENNPDVMIFSFSADDKNAASTFNNSHRFSKYITANDLTKFSHEFVNEYIGRYLRGEVAKDYPKPIEKRKESDIIVGDYLRANRMHSHENVGKFFMRKNNYLVHHIDENERNQSLDNLIYIEYPSCVDSRNGANAAHEFLHAIKFDEDYTIPTQVDIDFWDMFNPSTPMSHKIEMKLIK